MTAPADNPWLTTSLDDYEAHMSLPSVGQAALLAEILAEFVERERPESLALLGCAGGNGLERVDPGVTHRVVAVDVNSAFLDAAARRHGARFERFEALAGTIPVDPIPFEPVDLIYAGLLLEYVPVDATIGWMLAHLKPGGLLVTVLQLHNPAMPSVTPSPYRSLESLAPVFTYQSPAEVRASALARGAREDTSFVRRASGGKDFRVQAMRG